VGVGARNVQIVLLRLTGQFGTTISTIICVEHGLQSGCRPPRIRGGSPTRSAYRRGKRNLPRMSSGIRHRDYRHLLRGRFHGSGCPTFCGDSDRPISQSRCWGCLPDRSEWPRIFEKCGMAAEAPVQLHAVRLAELELCGTQLRGRYR
jgi:hypothetical protein